MKRNFYSNYVLYDQQNNLVFFEISLIESNFFRKYIFQYELLAIFFFSMNKRVHYDL